MSHKEPVIGAHHTFRREESASFWQSNEAFQDHVDQVADASRAKCARGSGDCSLRVTVESFDVDGAKATVSAYCLTEDCPDVKLAFQTPWDVDPTSRPSMSTPILPSEVSVIE